MKRIPVVLALLASLTLLPASIATLTATIPAAAKPEDIGFSADRLTRIHEMVERYLANRQLAGAVTLVARRGKVAHFEAHGVMDFESKAPMRKDAIFHSG